MTRRSRLLLFSSIALVFTAGPVLAQNEMDEAAMMEAWQKASTPGDVHKYLASFAGNWNVTSKTYMDPGQPPMESTGTAKKTMILGGRFLQEELTATMMGMPMQGLGLTGYNNTTGKMEFTWMDNFGTMMMSGSGTLDGNTSTMMSTYMDPLMNKEAKAKLVTKLEGPDAYSFMMYEVRDGKDVLAMEAHYTRAK